jgi:hypothetical protein
MIVFFIANVILLVILLIGLLRLLSGGDVFSLWTVLWKQVRRVLAVVLSGLYVFILIHFAFIRVPFAYLWLRLRSYLQR